MTHIYGPVPSRRLGYSLGVDILPFKTCSLDCIYCQLGPTQRKTVRRKKYYDADVIIGQIQKAAASGQRIDYITFSGSGEPTLNVFIGQLIRELKKTTKIPVAVLTNSTLLTNRTVRQALAAADLIVPSLDAVSPDIFERINRPHASLNIRKIIQGLIQFRREFSGKIWLEVLFVKGINDSPSHLEKLKKIISQINPDRIHLNTVVRPPAEKSAHRLNPQELAKIRGFFGEKAEIVADFDKTQDRPVSQDLKNAILDMAARRPVTIEDMSRSLGKHKNELIKYCDMLLKEEKIRYIIHAGKKFYESCA